MYLFFLHLRKNKRPTCSQFHQHFFTSNFCADFLVQRNERKKEEMKRFRKLVDNAYNSDPRIANFREMDKQEKLAKKKAKQDAAQARRDEEERIRYVTL